MAIPSGPEPPGLPEIWQELRALRLELAELRHSLDRQPEAAAVMAAPPEPTAVASGVSEPPARSAAMASLLARRNGERLQQEVRRRLAMAAAAGSEPGLDTEVDLLIDRLHDLADASCPSPCP